MKTINYNNRQPDTDITEKSVIDRFFSSKIFMYICIGLVVIPLVIILGLYLMTHVLKPKKITRRYVINTSDNPFQNTGNTAKKISEDILFYHKKK